MSLPPTKPDDATGIPVEYHKVRMTHLYELAAARFASAANFGELGLRSILIANGGALTGLVAFVGSGSVPSAMAPHISTAFVWFGVGLLLALLATLFAYFTQSFFARQESEAADQTYYANLGDSIESQKAYADSVANWRLGTRCELAALLCFGGSLIFFGIGAVASVSALALLSPAPTTTG